MKILLIDDEIDSRESVADFLKELGYSITECESAEKALEIIDNDYYPLIITDIKMPGIDGMDLIKILKENKKYKGDIIVYTGHGDVQIALKCLKLGAYDYMQKPINVSELAFVIERCFEHQSLIEENSALTKKFNETVEIVAKNIQDELKKAKSVIKKFLGIEKIIFESKVMKDIYKQLELLHTDPTIPVIIEGETGTGKEIIARYIHYSKDMIDSPFIDINCAAFSPELFESELFGYESGAFTGGKIKGEKGKLDIAENGTIFFDEIGDMPMNLQPKLLRVLQDKEYYPVGGLKKKKFNARVICATNKNLKNLIEEEKFRKDLYFRLNVGYIYIPPLRDRKDDILPLIDYFLERECEKRKTVKKKISQLALMALKNYSWPGNVRELENSVERLILTTNKDIIDIDDISFIGNIEKNINRYNSKDFSLDNFFESFVLPEENFDLEVLHTKIIHKVIEKFKGNKSKAAQYLNISRNSLYKKMEK